MHYYHTRLAENTRDTVNQSEVKPSFEWFDGLSTSFVIGQNDYNQRYIDHVIRDNVVAVPPTTPQSDKFSDVTELIL